MTMAPEPTVSAATERRLPERLCAGRVKASVLQHDVHGDSQSK